MNTKQVLQQIDELYKINAIKNNRASLADLNAIKNRVADDTFRVAVVGEFSSGKSTFINALMGMDLLSHAVNETTATITRVHNVEKGDPRLGTYAIEYRDGKKKTVNSREELYRYTTTQSAEDVAGTIQSVSVYVHFTDASYPIELVDTPGLNGIADKHREITIAEVKKAHACIYLLPLKGPTRSDAEFICTLQCYQSTFIFVQNFIDQLNPSEGETVEGKLDEDKKLIKDICDEYGMDFEYEICGVSSLNRLCARDRQIKKLYREDSHELTEEDRERFDRASRFSDFEMLLANLATGEKYKKIVITSAVQALCALIDHVRPGMIINQEINAALRGQDDKTKRIEKSRQIISRLKSDQETHRKKLSNFIISRDRENRSGLKEYVNHRLRKICRSVSEAMDERIRNFDDFEHFRDIEGKSVPEFYGAMAANMINSQVIPDIDRRIRANLSHLNDEAMQRVSGYTADFSRSREQIDIKIEENEETFQMEEEDFHVRIEKYKSIREEKAQTYKRLMGEMSRLHKSLAEVDEKLTGEKRREKTDSEEYRRVLAGLGEKPEVEKRTEIRSKRVKRGGLRSVLDIFDDGKLEYYEEEIVDDTSQRKWLQQYEMYLSKQQMRMEQHEKRISDWSEQKSMLEDCIKVNEISGSKLQSEIHDLEGRIEREREIFENALKQNRREFCDSQKNKTKRLLEDRLFDRTGSECTIERLEEHIDRMSNTYIGMIREKIDQSYIYSISARIRSLEELICENTERLETQYDADAKEIAALDKIKDILKEKRS